MKPLRVYGSWPSAIHAGHVAAAGRKFADMQIDPVRLAPTVLYWAESCPEEAGRNTIMRLVLDDGPAETAGAESLLDAPYSARSAVHEYGGGAFTVHDDTLWFVNSADQAIWQRSPEGMLTEVTPSNDGLRFADLQYDANHARLIAVVETLPEDGSEPTASIETISLSGQRSVVASDHDFLASPRLSPDGRRLVWLAWNHPDMPWDVCELWQAELADDGRIEPPQCVWAPDDASLFSPVFDPAGRLHVVCDVDNWWNIYRETNPGDSSNGFEQLTAERCEFGLPQWVFGQQTYGFDGAGRLWALCTHDGIWSLGEVDPDTGTFRAERQACSFFEQLVPLPTGVAVVAASAAEPKHIRVLDRQVAHRTVRQVDGLPAVTALAKPEPMSWTTGGDAVAYGLYYPPTSDAYAAPGDERPPLILKCHGGPTGATSTALDARIQYWTSRGYALLDVNYRGSTGYGRDYRMQLRGAWGVADVEDCVSGAAALAEQGKIDSKRVLISGSSAGGYTVLCVLTFTDIAAAGASYYGIGDLRALLASTHKFESRYLDRLIGDDADVLADRSPLMHADRLSCPVLFLQGMQDKVVPPDQAQAMVDALSERGIPVAYVCFETERHGFRDAGNIVTAIESERAFFTKVLGIPEVDDLIDLPVEHFEPDD
jgi:dipeptidyl aminopeptidase/acylaminoacyl peptidase